MGAQRLHWQDRQKLIRQIISENCTTSPTRIKQALKEKKTADRPDGHNVCLKTITSDVESIREENRRWMSDLAQSSWMIQVENMLKDSITEITILRQTLARLYTEDPIQYSGKMAYVASIIDSKREAMTKLINDYPLYEMTKKYADTITQNQLEMAP